MFDNNGMEPDAFTDMFIGAVEEAQPAKISKLIATMDKQQLTTSFQQMVQKWKELQENAAAGAQPCRPSASDSQLLRPATGTHTGAMTTSPKRTRRRLPELPRESGGAYHSAHRSKTPDDKAEVATGHDDKQRKPAAKLKKYVGQGASVESFLAKFESHAKYVKWSEQDRVFQLKNSLTGTAAQALWTGGENATSAELIQLLHSRHGGKLHTKRFWSELCTRRSRKDEPLQDVCQDIRRLMYLASPHETGPLAEHISIDLYVAAVSDPNMHMFVMLRDPVMLEDTLNYSIRYEALLLGATEQTQPAVLDPKLIRIQR